jgi:hypothetical protein
MFKVQYYTSSTHVMVYSADDTMQNVVQLRDKESKMYNYGKLYDTSTFNLYTTNVLEKDRY